MYGSNLIGEHVFWYGTLVRIYKLNGNNTVGIQMPGSQSHLASPSVDNLKMSKTSHYPCSNDEDSSEDSTEDEIHLLELQIQLLKLKQQQRKRRKAKGDEA